jgi:SecD/SecF fusion protein
MLPAMGGGVVTDAKDSFDQMGKPAVSMQMDEGAKSLGRINRKSLHSKSNIAIVLDNIVYSAPGVLGPISGGRSEISGSLRNRN